MRARHVFFVRAGSRVTLALAVLGAPRSPTTRRQHLIQISFRHVRGASRRATCDVAGRHPSEICRGPCRALRPAVALAAGVATYSCRVVSLRFPGDPRGRRPIAPPGETFPPAVPRHVLERAFAVDGDHEHKRPIIRGRAPRSAPCPALGAVSARTRRYLAGCSPDVTRRTTTPRLAPRRPDHRSDDRASRTADATALPDATARLPTATGRPRPRTVPSTTVPVPRGPMRPRPVATDGPDRPWPGGHR